MTLYLTTILVAMVIIAVINYFIATPIFGFDLPYIILAVVISTIGVIVVDLIFALIVRRFLPAKWFSVDKKGYLAGKKEMRFYEKLGVKRWKEKVPELGALTGFRKNKIANPGSVEYLGRYIEEANFGIIVHLSNAIFGFLIIFFYPLKYFLCFGVPVAFVNAILSIMPLIILRYNLPKLHSLYKYTKLKQLKESKAREKDE